MSKCKIKLYDALFFRYKHNDSEAFYEPLFGEHDDIYLNENNVKVLMLETSDEVTYADV